MAKDAEVGRVSVRVMPDTRKFNADLKKKLELIEKNLKVKVEAILDRTSVTKIKEQLGRLDTKVKVEVDVDLTKAKAAIERLNSDVSVDVDTAGAETRLAALSRDRKVNVKVDIDRSILSRLGALLATLGQTAATGAAIGVLSSAIYSLGVMILGVIGPLASFVSSLGALLGIAGPLPAILAGFGVGMLATVLALKDAGTVLKDLGPPLQQIQKTLSAAFWKRAEKPIRDLATQTLPLLEKGLKGTGDSLGGFFGELANSLKANLNADSLGIMFKGLNDSIDIAKGALAPLVKAFTTLGIVGSQYLPRLATWVTQLSEQFGAFIEKANADGSLVRWIEDGIQAMKDLGTIVAKVFGIVGSVGEAAKQAGHATLGTMAADLTKIDEALKSAEWQAGMVAFFTATKAGMDTILGAIGRLLTQFATMGAVFTSISASATQAIANLLDGITAGFANPAVQANLMKFFSSIETAAMALGPAIEGAMQIISVALAVVGQLVAALAPTVSLILSGLAPAFSALGVALIPVVQLIGESLMTAVQALMPLLVMLVSTVLPVLLQVISALLPIVTPLVQLLAAILAPALGLLTDLLVMLLPFIVEIATAVAEWLTALQPVVALIMEQLIPVILQLVEAVLPILMEAFRAIAPVVSEIIAALVPLVTMILGTLVPVIQKLIPVVTVVFQTISDFISAAMRIIQGVIKVVTGIIKGDWSQVWEGIKLIASGVWEAIKAVITGAINIVKTVIGAALGIIKTLWDGAWNGIKNLLGPVWAGISSAVSDGIGGIVNWFKGLPGQALGALSGFEGMMRDMGFNVIAGFIGGIESMARRALDAVGNVVGGAINAAKNLLGINSPSRVFMEFGAFTSEGLAIGITKAAAAAQRAMQGVVGGVVGAADVLDRPLPVDPFRVAPANLDNATATAGGSPSLVVQGPLISVGELVVDSDDRVQQIAEELWVRADRASRAQGAVKMGGVVA